MRFVPFAAVGVGFLLVMTAAAPAADSSPKAWVDANLDSVIALYKHIHANPELSFQESKTAARLAEELKTLGAEVLTGIGQHGVVGVLKNGDGPRLLIRGDMDALPVIEATGLPYASKVRATLPSGVETGVMHACGHDIHVSNLIGVGRYLAANKDKWQGTVLLVCQPAEEIGGGARAMMQEKFYDKVGQPQFCVALHVASDLEAGKVSHRSGAVLANVDSVDITMRGRGGHGSAPQTTIDPIVMAAQLVVELQTIVSREIAPLEPAVITVGSIHGGSKHNIISDECKLQLTVRSYSLPVREQLLSGIQRKAKAVAQGARAPEPIIKLAEDMTPALVNDAKLTARVVPALRKAVGQANVEEGPQSMGGEDFGLFGGADIPVCMYRLGSVNAERLAEYEKNGQKPPSLHSALFYPDVEATLRTGLISMISVALELLPRTAP